MKKWGQIPTWLRKGRVQHQIPAHELRKLVAVHCVIAVLRAFRHHNLLHHLRGLACLLGHGILHSVPAVCGAAVVIQTGHFCLLSLLEGCTATVPVISVCDVRKRQLAQDLCFPGSRSCQPIVAVFLMLRVPTRNRGWSSSLPKNQPTHALQ